MSAVEMPLFQVTRISSADFTAVPVGTGETNRGQFRVTKIDADGRVSLATASSAYPLGILQRKPKVNEHTTVMVLGVTKVVFGAVVAVGQPVVAGANGKVVAASSTAGTKQWILGIVWVAVTAANRIGSILLLGPKHQTV